ncbi:hypothetical protein ACFOWA_13010 [Pedobacter lithocola]|uniref:Uncharacterized protein n=1 Tax=Pedobacter lithocola TaxID=1908239 RepID=A0ABV8PDC6_9SPHI
MMKKLMLSKGKAMACLILMCLFLTQSCCKDNLNLNHQENKQLIAEEVFNQWYATNPVAKYISLDWSKARQTTIDGQNVVRVPTLNADPIALKSLNATLKITFRPATVS